MNVWRNGVTFLPQQKNLSLSLIPENSSVFEVKLCLLLLSMARLLTDTRVHPPATGPQRCGSDCLMSTFVFHDYVSWAVFVIVADRAAELSAVPAVTIKSIGWRQNWVSIMPSTTRLAIGKRLWKKPLPMALTASSTTCVFIFFSHDNVDLSCIIYFLYRFFSADL